jgi:hypothetical protein
MAEQSETAKLSQAQLEAVARASSAAEVAEICKGNWRPPNTAEELAAQAVKKQEQAEPRKPKFRSVDGFLVPIE